MTHSHATSNRHTGYPLTLESPRPSLTRYAWPSIAAALATILLKDVAWKLTGAVGLLSDAIESFVNLADALMALRMLTLAALPADEDRAHDHGKAEYFLVSSRVS